MKMTRLFKSLIKKSQNIIITTHIHPDADGIGSQIALCMALKEIGKNAICVNEKDLLGRYHYLDPNHCITSYKDYFNKVLPKGDENHNNENKYNIDLFIVVDTNSLSRIGPKVQSLVSQSKNLLFIDHHPAPKELAAIHCINTKMAATGELVGLLIKSLGIKFKRTTAYALYTAILIDTSSFRYPTVTSDTHRLIAELMSTGIEPPEAYNNIYGTKKLSYIQLLGIVLSQVRSTQNGEVAWLILTEKTLERYHVDPEDTHALVNYLLILDNLKVACMFRQVSHKIKISLRSSGDIDVGIMAQALGGGGHNHSAATIIEGKMEEVITEIIPKIEMMLSKDSE